MIEIHNGQPLTNLSKCFSSGDGESIANGLPAIVQESLKNSLQSVLKLKGMYVAMTSDIHGKYADLPRAADEESESDDELFPASILINNIPHTIEDIFTHKSNQYTEIHSPGKYSREYCS